MKISVFGTGYVGLVTGVAFADMGNDVFCVDIDENKIAQLLQGRSPIYEPGLDALLAANIASGRLKFTTDSREAVLKSQLLFIAVGTPPDENGSADLSHVLKVAETIAEHMDDYKVVINKSTVPVGTFGKVKNKVQEILDRRKSSIKFDVCSNPEFLREGTAIEDSMKPARVVIGVESEKAAQLMRDLYEPFLKNGNPIFVMDPPSSEMTKYAANSMLAAKISLMNEFARVCEKVGADIESVRRGIGSDPRIGPHFIYAGVGYGGSCFPKDVQALVRVGDELDENLEILKAVESVNKSQRERFYTRVASQFGGSLKGKKVALWGIAFKPGTDDIREAPAMYMLERLLEDGAHVRAFDPVASEVAKKSLPNASQVEFCKDQYLTLEGVDVLVIMTEWKSFKEPDFLRMKQTMKTPIVFDGRNIYSPTRMRDAGFNYISIGRP